MVMEETQYIEDLEDVLRANAVLERIRNGKERCYLLEDVEQELRLSDIVFGEKIRRIAIMNSFQRKPTSVGEILQEEFLIPLDLKINDLAEILDIHRNTASAIINNHSRVTLEMAVKLSKAFGTTPEFWLNLQNNVDLWELEHNNRFQQSLAKVKIANDWKGVPAFAM